LISALFDIGQRRTPAGWLAWVIPPYAAAIGGWVIYSATYAVVHPWTLATTFLCAMFALIFLFVGPMPSSSATRPSVIDWAFAAVSITAGIYMAVEAGRFSERIPQIDTLSDADMVLGLAFLALSVEATRRTTGLGLTLIVLVFLAYNAFGDRLDGVLAHGPLDLEMLLDTLVYSTNGIPGLPARVAASYAYLFILFGVLLSRSGGGEFFFNAAAVVSGRRVGGPAKIAVVSSGLYGMISGSSVSDVVTTGSITIPMMRRLGYPRVLAGAVEVSASTGGSLLPPVMGAAAFVMVEYTGLPYRDIAIAALVPALLYYVTIYAQVHLRSLKLGLRGLSAEEMPELKRTLREGGLFIIPLVVLTTALLLGFSPTYVAVFGGIAIVAVATLRQSTRMGPKALYDCLVETTLRMVVVTGACAAAGLVIGGITMTGLALKFAHLVYAITDARLFSSLLVAAVLTVILGLGMPTVSAYILAAVLVGPLLSDLGVPVLAAHMFLLYYAVMSAITPPVAVAAYAAASLAEDSPVRIAFMAVRLSLAAFVVPFIFVFHNELLLVGHPFDIAVAIVRAAIGVVLLAIAAEGYLRDPLSWWQRLLIAASAICLFMTGPIFPIIGLAVVTVALGGYAVARRKRAGGPA